MGYDPLAESRRLLADGLPAQLPPSLSRRHHRFAPLSFDVDGEVAVTEFVRRGVNGEPSQEHWTLARSSGEWRLLGGGGGSTTGNPLGPAPAAAELGGHVLCQGAGSTLLNPSHRLPWTGRYLRHASLRLAAEVHHLVVAGRRIDPPPHGRQIVLWTTRRPPAVEAFDGRGEPLAKAVPSPW